MPQTQSVVDRLYIEFDDLEKFVVANDGHKFRPIMEGHFPKTMLLAATSFFEHRISDSLEQLAKDETRDDHALVWLIKAQVISRRYHTWFDWDRRNVNKFLKMFGDDFFKRATNWIDADDKLGGAVRDFMEIGADRNRLVHGDFGTFVFDKTASEVYEKYKSAVLFVDWFPDAIRQHLGP